jgi:prostaglandin-E synthase
MSSTHPDVLWAQRKNEVFLSINVLDLSDEDLSLDNTSIKFKGTSLGQLYKFELEFFAEINVENSKKTKTAHGILCVLDKKDHDKSFWPRLTKQTEKLAFVKTDFARWKDEDESDNDFQMNPGLDFSQFGGNGMVGAGNEEESSDEEMPKLSESKNE